MEPDWSSEDTVLDDLFGLPPYVREGRARAQRHAEELIGMSEAQATSRAQELGIDARLYAEGAPLKADWRPMRINGELDSTGHVVRTWIG